MTPVLAWIIIVVSGVVAGSLLTVGFWFVAKNKKPPLRVSGLLQAVLAFNALAMLGATAGIVGGLSRVGIAGQVIPAALTFVGGVSLYLFSERREQTGIVGIGVTCLVATLFFGYITGAQLRDGPDRLAFWRTTCVAIYSDTSLPIDPIIDFNFGRICGSLFKHEHFKFGLIDR